MQLLLVIYLIGIVIGLAIMRDPWPTRVVTAIAWPLGVVAFVTVFVIMFSATIYLWPKYMVPLVALLAAVVWFIRL